MRSATLKRCCWVSVDDPLMPQYHDREWGVPVHKEPDAAVAGSARITGKPEIKRGPRTSILCRSFFFTFPACCLRSLNGNRFTRRADLCQSLSTSHKPVLSPLCFHGLTNCFSRKPFALINICVAPRVSPPAARAIQEFTSRTNQPFYRHTVMNSLSSRKNHLPWNQQLPHSFTKIPGGAWGMY